MLKIRFICFPAQDSGNSHKRDQALIRWTEWLNKYLECEFSYLYLAEQPMILGGMVRAPSLPWDDIPGDENFIIVLWSCRGRRQKFNACPLYAGLTWSPYYWDTKRLVSVTSICYETWANWSALNPAPEDGFATRLEATLAVEITNAITSWLRDVPQISIKALDSNYGGEIVPGANLQEKMVNFFAQLTPEMIDKLNHHVRATQPDKPVSPPAEQSDTTTGTAEIIGFVNKKLMGIQDLLTEVNKEIDSMKVVLGEGIE